MLCAAGVMLSACAVSGTQEDTLPNEPVIALKESALYTSERETSAQTPEPVTPDTVAPDTSAAMPPDTTAPESTAEDTAVPETTAETTTAAPETTVVTTTAPETTTESTAETTAETTTAETTAADVAVEQLLDFDVLQKVNRDIYAWLEIGGTIIDDPILQSVTDDTRYLNYGYDGKKSTAGALFTESAYNGRKFDDPVTMIYGHRTIKGHMFGALQATYSDADSFKEHSEICLYLPGEVRHYTVFAAVPYDNTHILYTYDFTTPYWYNNFFNGVAKIRAIGAQFNAEAFPQAGDRVIILSVCLEGDDSSRYLVMAVLNDDLADNTVSPAK